MNVQEKIEEYNASTNGDLEEGIYSMEDYSKVMKDYGFSEDEEVNILDDTFDWTQDFFWFGQDGYLYSGTEDDVLAIIGGDTKQVENTNTFYRYVVQHKGEEIGFIRAIDILTKEKVIPYSSDLDLLSVSLFSKMHVPTQKEVEGKTCWFTEKGKIKFSIAIQRIISLYATYGINVKEIKTELHEYKMLENEDDGFQCVA